MSRRLVLFVLVVLALPALALAAGTDPTKQINTVDLHVVVLGNGRGYARLLTFGLGNGIPSADLRAYAKLVAGRLAAAKL